MIRGILINDIHFYSHKLDIKLYDEPKRLSDKRLVELHIKMVIANHEYMKKKKTTTGSNE